MRGLTNHEFEVLHRRATNAPREVVYDPFLVEASNELTSRGCLRQVPVCLPDGGPALLIELTPAGALAYRLELAVRRGAP